MYIQEYGDRYMAGLWNWIVNGIQDNINRQNAGSSPEYKNAFSAANESIDETQKKANQYTGNEGYANTLEQAGKGAGTIANQAVGAATSGARNAGMSKAQAAQMGMQNANNAYANAFTGQQNVAQGMGQNAISAQQGITSAQQGQAGQAASEKQAQYNRKKDTMQTVSNAFGNMFGTGM